MTHLVCYVFVLYYMGLYFFGKIVQHFDKGEENIQYTVGFRGKLYAF